MTTPMTRQAIAQAWRENAIFLDDPAESIDHDLINTGKDGSTYLPVRAHWSVCSTPTNTPFMHWVSARWTPENTTDTLTGFFL